MSLEQNTCEERMPTAESYVDSSVRSQVHVGAGVGRLPAYALSSHQLGRQMRQTSLQTAVPRWLSHACRKKGCALARPSEMKAPGPVSQLGTHPGHLWGGFCSAAVSVWSGVETRQPSPSSYEVQPGRCGTAAEASLPQSVVPGLGRRGKPKNQPTFSHQNPQALDRVEHMPG